MQLTKNKKTKRQTVAVQWKSPVILTYDEILPPQDPTMKALIIYDDIASATNTSAILHRVAHYADITVKWDIKPWRLNMLKFPPTAEQALKDAAEAHLLVFALPRTPIFPGWLMDWLEEWAKLRQTPDAALAIIGDGTPAASVAPATAELSQFARQYGLSFIFNNHGGSADTRAFPDPGLSERQSFTGSASPRWDNFSNHAAYPAWGLND
jgi:hypothetical protein